MAAASAAFAQIDRYAHVATVLRPNGGAMDEFGSEVALGDGYVVVGARRGGVGYDWGSVDVVRLDGASWTLETDLVPSDGESFDDFGWSIDVDADRVVIGAPRHDTGGQPQTGRVYVFARCGSTWSEVARLDAPTPTRNGRLGWAVAVHGETIAASEIIGPGCGSSAGRVLVWEIDDAGTPNDPCDDAFSLQATLTSSACGPLDVFGAALALDGDRLVVGQQTADDFRGAAFVFERSGGAWAEVQRIDAPDGEPGDRLGGALALDADVLVAGVWDDDELGISVGSAYVYRTAPSGFRLEAKLANPTPQPDETFGASVDVEGDRLVVGNATDRQGAWTPGSVHVFDFANGAWEHVQVLKTPHAKEDSGLGACVALSGTRLVAGVYGDDPWGFASGSVYVHEVQQGSWHGYGYGDGSFGPCPCGNEARSGTAGGCESSIGQGARLGASGSDSAGADEFRLGATGLPPDVVAQLFSGPGTAAATPFGNGLLVVAAPLARHGVRAADRAGNAVWGPGLAGASSWSAGTTRAFQAWYRDAGGPCGAPSNTSNATSVTLRP